MESSYRPTRVKWIDTCHQSGWYNYEDMETIIEDDLYEVESIGWLVHEDEKKVILAQSRSDFKLGDLLIIPRSAVIDILVEKDDDPPAEPAKRDPNKPSVLLNDGWHDFTPVSRVGEVITLPSGQMAVLQS